MMSFLALLVVTLAILPSLAQMGPLADQVYGQPDFSSNQPNEPNPPGTVNAAGLQFPFSVGFFQGSLYVCDSSNSRVLRFLPGATTADTVWGQPNVVSDTAAVSATGMTLPGGVAITSCCLYVVDTSVHRVLVYPRAGPTGVAAFRVYGQFGSFTTSVQNNGGVSADSLFSPEGVAVERSLSGRVYIAELGNNRILGYDGTSTTATIVIGQADFVSNAVNRGMPGPTADSLDGPRDISFDAQNK